MILRHSMVAPFFEKYVQGNKYLSICRSEDHVVALGTPRDSKRVGSKECELSWRASLKRNDVDLLRAGDEACVRNPFTIGRKFGVRAAAIGCEADWNT